MMNHLKVAMHVGYGFGHVGRRRGRGDGGVEAGAVIEEEVVDGDVHVSARQAFHPFKDNLIVRVDRAQRDLSFKDQKRN